MFARTLLAPAGLAQTTAPDSVPNFSVATRLWKAPDLKSAVRGRNADTVFIEPRSNPRGISPRNNFFVLSAAIYGASLADMHQTLAFRNDSWWYETDPLAKPLVRLPAPAYYATGLAMATGLNWISWRMGHSRRFRNWRQFHNCWQLPETCTGSGPTATDRWQTRGASRLAENARCRRCLCRSIPPLCLLPYSFTEFSVLWRNNVFQL